MYTVRKLLEDGVDVNIKYKSRENLLHTVINYGYIGVTRCLIEKGKEMYQIAGKTSLHLASKNGHGKVINLLIEHGAEVNVKDNQGNIPLYYACKGKYPWIVEKLIKHDSKIHDDYEKCKEIYNNYKNKLRKQLYRYFNMNYDTRTEYRYML